MSVLRRLVRLMAASLAVTMLVSGSLAAAAAQNPPVRVGGDIKEPKRTKYVAPAYPDEAKSAGVEGTVVLEAAVATDGSVIDVKVLKSQPLLDKAAADAVQQWKYEPTTVNGEPVEVLMVVTVRFTLQADSAVAAAPAPRLRVGGDIKEPKRIKYVTPVYPPEALSAKVQGSVVMEAVIGTDGAVIEVKVLRSEPMLDVAAADAVKQWKYEPTTVNGEPVQVLLTVTVTFAVK